MGCGNGGISQNHLRQGESTSDLCQIFAQWEISSQQDAGWEAERLWNVLMGSRDVNLRSQRDAGWKAETGAGM